MNISSHTSSVTPSFGPAKIPSDGRHPAARGRSMTCQAQNPLPALLALHDISRELQKTYRTSALASQQKIFDETMTGIGKSRHAQRVGFILQMVGSSVQMVAGAVMLGMSTMPFKQSSPSVTKDASAPVVKPTVPANAAAGTTTTGAGAVPAAGNTVNTASASAGAAANGAAALPTPTPAPLPSSTVGSLTAKLKPPKVDSQIINARVMSIRTITDGLSGAFSNTGHYVTRLGELEQATHQAQATRETQMLDLRNSLTQEHSSNAREIRDTIRSIIPNRSFHA